jgi:acyl-CoA thioesterase-1
MNLGGSAYGAARRIVQALLAIVWLSAAPALAVDKLVLAFGDSLTAGYGLAAPQGFVPRLAAALRARGVAAKVYNAGVSGDTSAAGRARLAWVLAGVKVKPDLAIVELGANDMLRGLPAAQTRANLDAILAELTKRHIPVLIAGMRAAPNLGKAYAQAFEPIYPDLARKYHAKLYPFFLAGVAGQPGMQQADGMHPSPKGVEVMVRSLAPAVAAALR